MLGTFKDTKIIFSGYFWAFTQGERGQEEVYYISPQSFIKALTLRGQLPNPVGQSPNPI